MARITIDSKVLEKLVEYASAYADHADDTAHELGRDHPNAAGYERQAASATEAARAGERSLRSGLSHGRSLGVEMRRGLKI